MKRKLSLLLTMILAMTMVMGTGVTAFAVDAYSEIHVTSNGYSFDDITAIPEITIEESGLEWKHDVTAFYGSNGNWLYSYSDGKFHMGNWFEHLNPQPTDFSNVKYAVVCYQIYKRYVEGNTDILIDDNTAVVGEKDLGFQSEIPSSISGDLSNYIGYWHQGDNLIFYRLAFENDGFVPDTEKSSPAAHTHNFRWQTITEPTKDSDGLEGEVCSCGAMRNTQLLSAYGYALNEYAAPMINATKPGQTITFEFGEWNSFPKSFMAKLVDKSAQNVTFVFKYKWNHETQTITIPAGTPIDLNSDWYGPAKMAELYGNN